MSMASRGSSAVENYLKVSELVYEVLNTENLSVDVSDILMFTMLTEYERIPPRERTELLSYLKKQIGVNR